MARKKDFHKELEVLTFKSFNAFMTWLSKNFEFEGGVWLKLAKKASGIKSITYEEAREAAIIYGWIDGLMNRFDKSYYLIKFTARRKRSRWSKINRGIAESLIKEGRMNPSGLEQVNAAEKDGRWEAAYAGPASIEVPKELKEFFKVDPVAKERFENLTSQNRYAFLYRILDAKRLETTAKRVEQTKEMLINDEVHYPGMRKKKRKKKAVKKSSKSAGSKKTTKGASAGRKRKTTATRKKK